MVAKPIISTKIKIFILKYKIQDYIQDNTGKHFSALGFGGKFLGLMSKNPKNEDISKF